MTENLFQIIQELTDTGLVNAGISLRSGGISNSPYSSLNLATHVGDDPTAVIQNRQRFSKQSRINSIKYCHQIHSDTVILADTLQSLFLADNNQSFTSKNGDAIISNLPDDTLGVFTADCVPIFILDIETPAVGIVHAGWRGTIARIVTKTLVKMKDSFYTDPSNCLIHLGPSIQKCCYEVDNELLGRFEEEFGRKVHNGHSLCLQTANIIQLNEVGVKLGAISTSPYCTSCSIKMFYSYRAEGGETGRMLSYIQLKK